MYVVNKFLALEITLSGDSLPQLESIDPRDPQAAVSGAVTVGLPAGTREEIRIFCERLQTDQGYIEVAGNRVDTGRDILLERVRALATLTPASDSISVDLRLADPERAGTILAWRTADEIEITDDVIVNYPFAHGVSPRVSAEEKEGGDSIVTVVGDEARLSLSMTLRARDEGAPPDPDDRIFRIMRAISPQGDFFFYGRNLAESYIIGKSAQRAVRHVYTEFGRESLQPVTMEVL